MSWNLAWPFSDLAKTSVKIKTNWRGSSVQRLWAQLPVSKNTKSPLDKHSKQVKRGLSFTQVESTGLGSEPAEGIFFPTYLFIWCKMHVA